MQSRPRMPARALLAVFVLTSLTRAHNEVTIYNGSGLNPVGFHSRGDASLGNVWTSTVEDEHVAQLPGIRPGLESFVLLGLGGPASPGQYFSGRIQGELLCLGPLRSLSYSPTGLHRILIPNAPALLGSVLCTQAAVVRRDPVSGPSLELQNALLLYFAADHCHGSWDCGG